MRAENVTLPNHGLGLAQLGNLYRETTDLEAESVISAAWTGGIRYFDTAPHYGLGLSERRAGALLAKYRRTEFALSTKVGRLLVPDPTSAHLQDSAGFAVPADHRRVWDFSRDGVLRSLESSLKRLNVEHIEVVYVHDPDDHIQEAIDGAIPALLELREQGVISAVGVGMNQSAAPARFIRELDLDLVMLAGRYTLLDQSALDDLLPLADQRGVGIVIAGVYNSGLLAKSRPSAGARFDYEPAPPELLQRARAIADVCEIFGVTLPEAALAFPRLHPAVTSVVVGARTGEQVDTSLARSTKKVPDELWQSLLERNLIRHESIPH